MLVHAAHHVVVSRRVVHLLDRDGLPHPELHVRRGHVVRAREVEQVGAGQEAAGVDLGDTRLSPGIFLEVDAEDSGGARIHGADGPDRHVHHARLGHGARQRRGRRHAARIAPDRDVGQPLEDLDQHEPALPPEALAGKIPAGEIFGQREAGRGDATHRLPVRDPAPRLLRGGHGHRARRIGSASHPAPGARRTAEASIGFAHGANAGEGQRPRHG